MNTAFVYKCVGCLFADLMNEDNVGNGFRWYNFPQMASVYVKNRLIADAHTSTRERDRLGEMALEYAKELMERANASDQ